MKKRIWFQAGAERVMPATFAWQEYRSPQSLSELWRPVGLLTVVFCGLLLVEPDLGTAISLVAVLAAMLLVAGTPGRTLAGGLGIATTFGLLAIWFEPYRRARIFSFLNPWQDAQGAGFQTVQAMIGLGSGGIFGVGIGNGVQKAFYLPEAHTDMISAVIGEELGLVGIVGVVGLFAMFGYAGLKVAQRAKDAYGKLLVAGLTSLIVVQAIINLFAVMGLAPLTGVPLPFVSYGNSSLMTTLFAVGLILNVARGGTAASARSARPRAGKLRVVEGGRSPARLVGPRVGGPGRAVRGGFAPGRLAL